jgi:hypothetical protein
MLKGCRVLDIDPVKKMADLSEKLGVVRNSDKEVKEGTKVRVLVELNKEGYLVVTLKNNRSVVGVCIPHNFNQDSEVKNYQIGEELEGVVEEYGEKVVSIGLVVEKEERREVVNKEEMKEGNRVVGILRKIKQDVMYLEIRGLQKKKSVLARLQMVECESKDEFHSYT